MATEEKKTKEETRPSSEEISFGEMMRKMMSECGCAGMMDQMMACCTPTQDETSDEETPPKA